MISIKFISYLEASGYGLAGIAYVRGLVNAGVPVQWAPLRRQGWDVTPWRRDIEPPPLLLSMARNDDALADLPACRRFALPGLAHR